VWTLFIRSISPNQTPLSCPGFTRCDCCNLDPIPARMSWSPRESVAPLTHRHVGPPRAVLPSSPRALVSVSSGSGCYNGIRHPRARALTAKRRREDPDQLHNNLRIDRLQPRVDYLDRSGGARRSVFRCAVVGPKNWGKESLAS
jgi:hypothetical protein